VAASASARMPNLYSAVKDRRLALATTSGFGRGGAGGSEAPVLPAPALRSASLRSASRRCAGAGETGGEAGEAEDIPLFFTWIPILALLSNYDQEICLIHVGTEGGPDPQSPAWRSWVHHPQNRCSIRTAGARGLGSRRKDNRFTDQVQACHCGGSGDDGQGVFQWHRGISGGMAQFLGSTAHPSSRQPE
jgi:hypothetical protein